MLTKNTCTFSNVGNRGMSWGGGAGEENRSCGAAREDFKARRRNRMCSGFLKGYQNTFIQFGCNPFISFLTQPIGFFENEAKCAELGTAPGLRTGCEKSSEGLGLVEEWS